MHQSSQDSSDCVDHQHHQISSKRRGSAENNFRTSSKVRSKSDFRAAMKLAQTACSDIMEESGSSSSGLQMKSMKQQKAPPCQPNTELEVRP